MFLLGIHTGHDAAAALFQDYTLIAFVKEERVTRIKSDGIKIPMDAIQECLSIANIEISSIDAVCLSRAHLPVEFYKKTSHWNDGIRKLIGKSKLRMLANEMRRQNVDNELDILNVENIKKALKLREDVIFDFTNHHYSHILGAFFYSTWKNNSLYISADGGGDGLFYSAYYFNGKELIEIYGGDHYMYHREKNQASVGQAYSYVTELLGFTPNKHEGKITGLAAFGKPLYKDELIDTFIITEDGRIDSTLDSLEQLQQLIQSIHSKCTKEDLAATVQAATEEVIIKWVEKLMSMYNIENIGMSGGVFSNVRLNQKVAEIETIKDVFIFPPMGDEGLCVGNILSYLIKEKGMEGMLSHRHNMPIPYYGQKFSREQILNGISKDVIVYEEKDYIAVAAKLLQKYVGAIFYSGMEAGPRALGARSMIASPADRDINTSLNNRLNRTEFMPFAPYVRDIDAKKVFVINDSQYNACKFMTITTDVHQEYQDKIPAVVHVDNTARPQIITREDNYLYYDVLTQFEALTGLPVLINTSFNAHEEPIVNTPQEALQELYDDRIDFLIFEGFIVLSKKVSVE